MPKSETPATRRSARVAAASAGPKAASTKAANGKSASTKKASKDSKEKEESKRSARSSSSKAANGDAAEGAKEEKKKAATNSKGPLKLGQKLPKITLQDNKEDDVDVSTLTEEGRGVVLFLYPRSTDPSKTSTLLTRGREEHQAAVERKLRKAFPPANMQADTPGCTNQACGYRDAHDEIAALGYDVYGLSKDKPTAQQKSQLIKNPTSEIVPSGLYLTYSTNRSHFIFEKGTGELVDIAFRVKPADDPGNVLKFIKAHHKDD
ncbi:hypothetical protein A1Q2_02956 [Trichosporon asahii var. asahii CBS 8904]|uniref:Alkyl hydroperoxide reductase subunit C/ Thiol specific antioxidant domain-containing protein n=1 Tax=Trichosporon asahii var. asahii (strain CBS 8904) TaxID=1220162 RepID=K1VQ46_TRIAC|nr:hypothetical protein A1Q2_02956 [Trichosporon asahii var. asahii CBS 8904]